MIEFNFSEDREPQTFKPCRSENNRLTANIICPECFKLLHLNPHKVATDGTVFPSVVCDCGFHHYIKLNGWKKLNKKKK